MLKNGIDANSKSDTQRFSYLDIPTKDQYLFGTTILISIDRFVDNRIDVDY